MDLKEELELLNENSTIADIQKELDAAQKKLDDTNTKKALNSQDLEETREKIGLLKEIMKDVQKNIQGEIWYSVRNEKLDVLGSFYTLNEAIFFAEKKDKN